MVAELGNGDKLLLSVSGLCLECSGLHGENAAIIIFVSKQIPNVPHEIQ